VIYAGVNSFKNDPNAIQTFGYSVNGNVCLELCKSKTLQSLVAARFHKAQSEAEIDTILREHGEFGLWWRTLTSARTVNCLGDGKYAKYKLHCTSVIDWSNGCCRNMRASQCVPVASTRIKCTYGGPRHMHKKGEKSAD